MASTQKGMEAVGAKMSASGKGLVYQWIEPFLEGLAERGIAMDGLRKASISRSTADALRRAVPEFAERWEEAIQESADKLEEEMHSRLTDPHGNRGSDVLLMFNLKALRPNKYREQPTQVRVTNNKVNVKLSLGDAKEEDAVKALTDAVTTVEGTFKEVEGLDNA